MTALLRSGSINTTVAAGATSVAPSVLLPANLPIIIEVFNRHSTPASLSTIGLSDSAGTTFTQIVSVLDGNASPTRRLTRFRALVPVNKATDTITAVALNGIAQTEIGIRILYASGADVSGSNASGACVQTVTGNTAGGTATSLSIAISMSAGDGALATFASAVAAAITPRALWTETADNGLANSDLETQFRANTDTAASASGSNGNWLGIVTELLPLQGIRPAPTVVASFSSSSAGYSNGVAFTIANVGLTFKAGKTYYAVLNCAPSSTSPFTAVSLGAAAQNGDALSNPSATALYSYDSAANNGQMFFTWRLDFTGLVDVAAFISANTIPATSGNAPISFQIVEVSNVDTSQGTQGEIQHASAHVAATAVGTIANATFAKPTNFALLLFGDGSGTPTFENGWNLLSSVQGNTVKTHVVYRETAPSPTNWGLGGAGSLGTHGTVIELAPLIIYSPPAVTLVTPTNGSTIANTASITIDVTDVDGDLSTVVITTDSGDIYTAGAFQTGYTGSSKTTITNGFRFVVTPTLWPAGSLGILVTASDARSLRAVPGFFTFTISAPPVHEPVITLVGPTSPGPISDVGSVDIQITDADDDLDTVTIRANGDIVYRSPSFDAAFSATSSVSVITHGLEFVFLKTGGWGHTTLSVEVEAHDAAGHVTTAFYNWTPVTAPSTSPPVWAVVTPSTATPILPSVDLVLDVTDADGDLTSESISAVFGGVSETVWNGSAFVGLYTSSTRTPLGSGNQRFTLRRAGGWLGAVTLTGLGLDSVGNVGPFSFSWAMAAIAAPPSTASAVGDVKLEWLSGENDAVIVDDDIGTDRGLRTAVLVSLFTDRRAEPDDVLPADDGNRRGWWADGFAAVDGDLLGSRLWLLERSTRAEGIEQRAEEMIREALAWMLEDKVTDRIDVTVTTSTDGIFYTIGINRPQGDAVSFKFAHTWTAEASEAT